MGGHFKGVVVTGKVEAVIPPVDQEAVHGVGAPRIDGAAADVLLIRRHVVGKARPDLFREIRNPGRCKEKPRGKIWGKKVVTQC